MPTERYQDENSKLNEAQGSKQYFLKWTAIIDKEGRQKEQSCINFIITSKQDYDDMQFAINGITDQILEHGGAAVALTYTNTDGERRLFVCNNIVAIYTNFEISKKEEFEQ